MLYEFIIYWKRIFKMLLSTRNKIYVLCHPIHPNLGDQAQLMCTDLWIKKNYPKYQIVHLGFFKPTLCLINGNQSIVTEFSYRITLSVLRLIIRKDDLFIGHSGYFMVDHHNGYKMFTDIMGYFPNHKMVIFPQTIKFHTPAVIDFVTNVFSKNKNTILMCRDEISFEKAKMLFPTTPLLLYPDIVTSLIGTRNNNHNKRDGVLFCMRDDLESYYAPQDVDALIERFRDVRKEKVDTTIKGLSIKELDSNRDVIINDMIDKFSTYKVVITDRYHGTIFSAIASTPVVVISSADHKLSSGVKWFPKDIFGDTVQYAQSLDEAYEIASSLLKAEGRKYCNPPYFKEKYWDNLKKNLPDFYL
ncbi:MAG: polysaccharide pyruvyl transferase family protein [Prevotellaceae bacterium]|nr:polysaccharide pyruvyl transferase family protein [Prevotellaceae bacterium]